MCESEHCKCDEGILSSSLRHTVHIALFIFFITLVLNVVIGLAGEDALRALALDVPVVGELVIGIVGMIPNCAASVVITELYIEGVIGFGPMMTGLLAGAGVGALVLCRINKKHPKQNAGILIYVYFISVFFGVLFDVIL
jgi:hypothetical protein